MISQQSVELAYALLGQLQLNGVGAVIGIVVALLHIARVQPVPGEKLVDALGERRLQASVVPVHRGVANAAVPRDGVQRLALVAEQRHAQVGRSPVND